jgi:hypothetical protein
MTLYPCVMICVDLMGPFTIRTPAKAYSLLALLPSYCEHLSQTTLQATPCQLVFGRDMIHNIAVRANWDQIQRRKQKQDIINKSNQKENKNKSRIPYEYKVGDQVLLETPGILRKLSTCFAGLCPVTNVYKNGTIRLYQ